MNKFSTVNKLLFSGACLLIFSSAAGAVVVEGFPPACSEATTNQALEGHIIQLGVINAGPEGLLFSFPDQNDRRNLQSIGLADNVGLIGQDPEQDFSEMIKQGTPEGSFLVAQVFIGDEQSEPVVTCLSRVIPITRFVPSDYGPRWSWLDRGIFIERLRWKRHRPWNWRKWWNRDFSSIRSRFRDSGRDRRWTIRTSDRLRDRSNRRDLSRDRDRDSSRSDRLRDRTRDRVLDTTKKVDRLRDRTRDRVLDTTKKLDRTDRVRILKKDTTSRRSRFSDRKVVRDTDKSSSSAEKRRKDKAEEDRLKLLMKKP